MISRDRFYLRGMLALAVICAMLAASIASFAQESSSKPQQQSQQQPQPQEQQQVPGAGGPGGDIGPYSIPKKKESPPPEPVRPPKNPPEIGNFSITKDVSLVNVPVSVTTANGQFIPHLQEGNFKLLEDGVPQKLTSFAVNDKAPITAVLLVEFASTNYGFMVDALNASYAFAESLKPDDWIAVISYDMKPRILTDFTQDKRSIMAALNTLRIPLFSETNMFDALVDTVDRLDNVEGRKYVILVSSGRDTFSKLTWDKVLKRLKGTQDITIFAISTGRALRNYLEGRYGGNIEFEMRNLDFLQADNEMKNIANLTGGHAYFPTFPAEFPEVFREIGANIRNQYVLAYHPSNPKLDGSYRKLKVEVVDAKTGGPLKVIDQKGKNIKYIIQSREGYTAKHQVE